MTEESHKKEPISKKEYDKELYRLQVELVK